MRAAYTFDVDEDHESKGQSVYEVSQFFPHQSVDGRTRIRPHPYYIHYPIPKRPPAKAPVSPSYSLQILSGADEPAC